MPSWHTTVSDAVTRLVGVEDPSRLPRLAYPHFGHFDIYSPMLW
jgi:hypothetical protein